MGRRTSQELLSGAVASIAGGGGGGDLNDLDDVNAGSPSDDDSLTYDSASGKWVPQAISGGAGGDWTNVILGTQLDVTSTTPADSDLAFSPADSKVYEVRILALCRTESVAVGARAGIKWPTAGITDGAFLYRCAVSGSNILDGCIFAGSDENPAVGGAASTSDSHLQMFEGIIITTTGVTGDFVVTLRGENATAEVHLMAGSVLSYREVA